MITEKSTPPRPFQVAAFTKFWRPVAATPNFLGGFRNYLAAMAARPPVWDELCVYNAYIYIYI